MARLNIAVVAAAWASAALAQDVGTYRSNTVDIPPATAIPSNALPGASGALRGDASLAGYYPAEPTSILDTEVPTSLYSLAPGQTANPTVGLSFDFSNIDLPQPIRGGSDSPDDPGPRTPQYERLNPNLYAPPGTDSGAVPNAKWPLALGHNRHGLKNAGWARQQNKDVLPAADAMAGVDMRLEPNAYRELHWHKASEWALMLRGNVRLNAVDASGATFVDDLQEGDVWFFPPGVPHSIQAGAGGCEFLLVFDDGEFSEDGTFLVSETFERMPREVLAKNFRTDVSAFDELPDGQLYIFPGTAFPADIQEDNITGTAGSIPQAGTYSYHWSQQANYTVPGGALKILDPVTFPIAENFAAALVYIEPGAMREIHWHLTSDEWNYFLAGQGRITVFAAPESSSTFDYSAGDVGYIPVTDAHYIENTGNETLVFLEVLQAPRFEDISVAQWLGLTPRRVVKDHFPGVPNETLDRLPKEKPYLLPGTAPRMNLTATNFTAEAE